MHEPGRGLVAGCPFHAWDYLVAYDGRLMCECQAQQLQASQ